MSQNTINLLFPCLAKNPIESAQKSPLSSLKTQILTAFAIAIIIGVGSALAAYLLSRGNATLTAVISSGATLLTALIAYVVLRCFLTSKDQKNTEEEPLPQKGGAAPISKEPGPSLENTSSQKEEEASRTSAEDIKSILEDLEDLAGTPPASKDLEPPLENTGSQKEEAAPSSLEGAWSIPEGLIGPAWRSYEDNGRHAIKIYFNSGDSCIRWCSIVRKHPPYNKLKFTLDGNDRRAVLLKIKPKYRDQTISTILTEANLSYLLK